jgi:hypothetical protein
MDASNTSMDPPDRPLNDALPLTTRLRRMLTFNDRLSRRTALILWLIATIGLGLYVGWGLVVAAGLSTLVLSLLPCAAMCALGLCAAGSGKKCSSDTQDVKGDDR